MKKLKVTIEGTEYTIDIEKAKSLGVLKEGAIIKDFKVGDMYALNELEAIIIIETGYCSGSYSIIGLSEGLGHYSDFGEDGVSSAKMLEYLQMHYTSNHFVKNINNDFKKLVKKALENQ
jgi:hypothetical protein